MQTEGKFWENSSQSNARIDSPSLMLSNTQETPAIPKLPIPSSPPDAVTSPLSPPPLQSPVVATSKRTFDDAATYEQTKRQKIAQSIFTMIEYHIECQTITPDEVIEFVSSLAPPVEDHVATTPNPPAKSTVPSSSPQPSFTQTNAQSSVGLSEHFNSESPINTPHGLLLDTSPPHIQQGPSVSNHPVTASSLPNRSTHDLSSSNAITPSSAADTITRERDETGHDDHGGDESMEDEFSDEPVNRSRTETWGADQSIEEDAMETETLDGDESEGDDLSDEDFDMTQVETMEADTSDGELSDDDRDQMYTDSEDSDGSYHPDIVHTLPASRHERAPSPPSRKPKKPQKTRTKSDLEKALDDDEDDEYEESDDSHQVDNRLKGAQLRLLDLVVPIEDEEFLLQLQEAQGIKSADQMDVRAEATPPPEPEYVFNPDDDLSQMIDKAV